MNRALQLVGGGLDGCFLPVHPRYTTAPTNLLIYNPEQGHWLSYEGGEADSQRIVDVYKIPDGVPAPSVRPVQPAEVFRLAFVGQVPPTQAKEIERLTQQRQRTGNCDVQEL